MPLAEPLGSLSGSNPLEQVGRDSSDSLPDSSCLCGSFHVSRSDEDSHRFIWLGSMEFPVFRTFISVMERS